MKKIILIAMIITLASGVLANNVVVESIGMTGQNTTDKYAMITFDVSWDNSWHTGSAPFNYDGVWVFAKWQTDGGNWSHCTLNTSSVNHIAPTGSTIEAVTDGKGIFIYRNANGSGSNNWDGVQLRWQYGSDGVADGDNVTVKIFAIEMVNIPEGPYYVGDGMTDENAYTEERITSADASIDAGSPAEASDLNASYPNGYSAFWLQKYEISEGQWVDFFNTLTTDQKADRDITGDHASYGGKNSDEVIFRNTVSWSSGDAATTAPDRACCYLAWDDARYYADWAGLRPMTELEYEKACRGDNNTENGSFAWGNTTISQVTTITDDGAANATANNGNCSYNAGDIAGPVRCGIFANGSSSREDAGAGYYGNMELTCNVWEHVINDDDTDFAGELGDGDISSLPTAWPPTTGIRGGGWKSGELSFGASSRINMVNVLWTLTRINDVGFRPCR
jgi:formylglycine-generating enzyme required for sulfatase activity